MALEPLEQAVHDHVHAFCEAVNGRDLEALRGLVDASALTEDGPVGRMIEQVLDREVELAATELVKAGVVPGRANAVLLMRDGVTPRRALALLRATPSGEWRIVSITTEPHLAGLFVAGLYDGEEELSALPISGALTDRTIRLIAALERKEELPVLAEVLGDDGPAAQRALAMLRGNVDANKRLTPLAAREHPAINRGAFGLYIYDLRVRFGTEYWFICETDGDHFVVTGTSSFMSVGLMLGGFGPATMKARVHPVETRARAGGGDAFDQAIRRALEEAVEAENAGGAFEDEFDRAVRGRMTDDEGARSRFNALFEQLADDRKEAILERMFRPGNSEGKGPLTLDALWKDGALADVIKEAVATYVAPVLEPGSPLTIDSAFLSEHGEALVGAIFAAVFKPITDQVRPETLLGDP